MVKTVNGSYLIHFWSDLDVLGLVLNTTGMHRYDCDNPCCYDMVF
jgi:hypothetical protein